MNNEHKSSAGSLGEFFHEIPFLFPVGFAIVALCLILIHDMANGGDALAGIVGIIMALGSITFIDIAIPKIKKF